MHLTFSPARIRQLDSFTRSQLIEALVQLSNDRLSNSTHWQTLQLIQYIAQLGVGVPAGHFKATAVVPWGVSKSSRALQKSIEHAVNHKYSYSSTLLHMYEPTT